MLYILKSDDYLKNLTDYEVEDFVVINFGEYFKCAKEKLCFKLNEEQNVRKMNHWITLSLSNSTSNYNQLWLQSRCK